MYDQVELDHVRMLLEGELDREISPENFGKEIIKLISYIKYLKNLKEYLLNKIKRINEYSVIKKEDIELKET